MEEPKRYHLPWNEADHYWIILQLPEERREAEGAAMAALGLQRIPTLSGGYMVMAPRAWGKVWKPIGDYLLKQSLMNATQCCVVTDDKQLSTADIQIQLKPATAIHNIAENLWLGDAMIDNRLTCYMQSVVDKRGMVFGHESFVRLQQPDGEIVGGGKIIAASRELNVQHALDRYLHVLAVRTFTSSNLTGCLFVNFISGFIHRPAVYLEGLTEATLRYGMPAKHIVLDFTRAESQRDLQQMKNIVEYGRSKGFLVALDDIETVDKAEQLIPEIRPDFMKLDIGLVHRSVSNEDLNTVKRLVEIAHTHGAMILAEGVETKEIHERLLAVGVDLFQGYLFSKPSATTKRDELARG